jgi:hypothetical protein
MHDKNWQIPQEHGRGLDLLSCLNYYESGYYDSVLTTALGLERTNCQVDLPAMVKAFNELDSVAHQALTSPLTRHEMEEAVRAAGTVIEAAQVGVTIEQAMADIEPQLAQSAGSTREILGSEKAFEEFLKREQDWMKAAGLTADASLSIEEWAWAVRNDALELAKTGVLGPFRVDEMIPILTANLSAYPDPDVERDGPGAKRFGGVPPWLHGAGWITGGAVLGAVNLAHIPVGVTSAYTAKKMVDRGFEWLGPAGGPNVRPA